MTVAVDYAVKRTELLDKFAGVLREFRNAMLVNGSVAPQEYVAWWGGLDRSVVGMAERAQRDLGFKKLRQVIAAYNATWAMFGAAMDAVDPIPIVPINEAPRVRAERPRIIVGRPLLRALANILYKRRIELEQTQESMAYLGGLDRGFVGAVERGERSMGFVKLRDVLATYRMTWSRLGQELHERDPIPRFRSFPAWPGSRAILRGNTRPPWGPAAGSARCAMPSG